MFQVQRETDRNLLKMASNTIPTTSTPSMPTFIPKIVMIATYTQQTQMPIIISTSSTVQTDTQTLHHNSTQTKTFQTTQATQTSPPQNSRAVQTEHMLNDTSAIDSTDSSTSTDVLDEVLCQSTWTTQIERERYTIKIIVLTTKPLANKERE